jgi:hypothetical protein
MDMLLLEGGRDAMIKKWGGRGSPATLRACPRFTASTLRQDMPMKQVFAPFALVALLGGLSACGSGSSAADNSAAQLEQAAEQSTPEAANVLDNAAEQIRDGNGADANAAAQQALQEAGNVQAAGRGPAPTPQAGAKPHQPGDPVPPPKTQ